MRTALVVCALAACGDQSPPPAPRVEIQSSDLLVEYSAGLEAWSRLGFSAGSGGRTCERYWYALKDFDCTLTVTLTREDGLHDRLGLDGTADRGARAIVIDSQYSERLLVHLVAHELGHILLDCGHLGPDEIGIMAAHTAETVASSADYALACQTLKICIPAAL